VIDKLRVKPTPVVSVIGHSAEVVAQLVSLCDEWSGVASITPMGVHGTDQQEQQAQGNDPLGHLLDPSPKACQAEDEHDETDEGRGALACLDDGFP